MIFKIVVLIVVMNLIYELIEIIFPVKKLNLTIKSFALLIMLYAMCDYLMVLL